MWHWLKSTTNKSGRIATIDAVKAAPPPSPLAPVDLTDPAQVAGVMDLAARIGDILLSSGTSNRDTVAQVHAVTSAYGLHYAHVDITLNTITVFTTIGTEKKLPVSVFRVVSRMATDFSKLSEVDRLVRSIQSGATPPEVAENILDGLFRSPASYGFKTSLMGWGGLGASVSVMLGGGVLVALVSFIISVMIMVASKFLARHQLPPFFQNIFGGFIATVPAAITYQVAHRFDIFITPSHIIAAGIVVMLASLTFVQSIQDGITGAPVTASARFFETLLLTSAVVAGVGAGIQASEFIGISLPPLESLAELSLSSASVKIVAGACASISFAVASYAEGASIFVAGLTGGLGAFIYYFALLPGEISVIISTSIAATVIGFAGGLMARRFLIPPLITAIAGITPLLPGLALYRGMFAALNSQMLVGFTNMALALSIAAALASGVVLGEWMARRLRRPPSINFYRYFPAPMRQSQWKKKRKEP
ncbi:MAG: threonine/serine exporter family protein [Corynebacterium sp.]|uniref:threonine/serine exporter ThrE n=1 Tax=Corynebacterium sp. TaxID=1720 RepID=UPI0026DADA1D|nr:threonine/serine exporter family protein [Corynebacterium sp.]MDO4761028.1 threonine/serine exporter family protein [Corynebacterium sp.]